MPVKQMGRISIWDLWSGETESLSFIPDAAGTVAVRPALPPPNRNRWNSQANKKPSEEWLKTFFTGVMVTKVRGKGAVLLSFVNADKRKKYDF